MNIPKNQPIFTIGAAAEALGVSVHTLRMYEREGLIIPFRKRSNQRRYSQDDIEHLQCLRTAITRDKVSIEGLRRLLSLVPCWSVINCTENDRASCAAFDGDAKPCWVHNREQTACAGGECRSCPVYAEFRTTGPIRNHLKLVTLG